MSLEVHVFLRKLDLPAVGVWQRYVDQANFPVVLYSTFDPTRDSGFVPCKLRGSETGFEYLLSPLDDIALSYPALKEAVRPYDSAATFSWGSRLEQGAVSLVAAATLAAASSGVMYDPQEATLYDGAGALKYVRGEYDQILAAMGL